MRIASLLPSAGEVVYALGLGNDLVVVLRNCDYPLDWLPLDFVDLVEMFVG